MLDLRAEKDNHGTVDCWDGVYSTWVHRLSDPFPTSTKRFLRPSLLEPPFVVEPFYEENRSVERGAHTHYA